MRDRQSSTGFSTALRGVPARWFMAMLLAGGLAGCSFTSPDEATGSQSVGIHGVTGQQARSIAREAYLYGTPMVASYQTMYAFSIDKNNPVQGAVQHGEQYRARLHPRRHGLRHPQLRHAILVRHPGPAR